MFLASFCAAENLVCIENEEFSHRNSQDSQYHKIWLHLDSSEDLDKRFIYESPKFCDICSAFIQAFSNFPSWFRGLSTSEGQTVVLTKNLVTILISMEKMDKRFGGHMYQGVFLGLDQIQQQGMDTRMKEGREESREGRNWPWT